MKSVKGLLVATLLTLLIVSVASAAPDGFRLSAPLTARAVAVGRDPAMTVHCARTTAVWRQTVDANGPNTLGRSVGGLADRAAKELWLPPRGCQPLERWLQGKRVDMQVLSYALFVIAHETGHIVLNRADEPSANCYATNKYTEVALAFGVKSTVTLQRLRNDAPLIPFLC